MSTNKAFSDMESNSMCETMNDFNRCFYEITWEYDPRPCSISKPMSQTSEQKMSTIPVPRSCKIKILLKQC